ncbi:cobalt-precorrin-5B (C(1))-methyltransferase, partial [Candidatus Bathyarchaeota archaeon]|nr:cobalt-precorrin-5B (C(1))-methyltransferase [Candidatus Bathyarchaeota archaeon]
KGAEVTIEVPDAEKIADRTFNPKLGIIGGISILGTTGVVKPYSIKAYRLSLIPQIDIAIASGYDRVVMVPGNIGAKFARQLLNAPEDAECSSPFWGCPYGGYSRICRSCWSGQPINRENFTVQYS